MNLLMFGMKHRNSKCKVVRLIAEKCIESEKKKADREEAMLKKKNIRQLNEKDAKELLKKLKSEKDD